MWYVYVLQCLHKDAIHTGFTSDLKRRFEEHAAGKVQSTRYLRPLKIIYYEAFLAEEDARTEERFLKTGYGREILRAKIKQSRSLVST